MKVLYVIDALGEGGTERSLADLIPRLAEEGIEPVIVILKSRGDEGVEPLLRRGGTDIRVLPPGGLVRQARALRRLVRQLQPDLIHSMLFASNMRTRAVRALRGPPVINSMVNMSYASERLVNPALTSRKLGAVRRIDAFTSRWVDQFHAVSSPVASHVVQSLGVPPSRVTIVERGRASTAFPRVSASGRSGARAALGLTDDAKVLVNLARHEHQKGIDTLLAATSLLVVQHDGVVVLQAGRAGEATSSLRSSHDRLALGNQFRFLGHRKDVDVVLAAADLFVFPSRYEGMPGAVIEAMAVGLPIVASDVETVVGVLEPGHNAMVVPVDDPGALAAVCRQLLEDPERRRQMGDRSRSVFEERFTIERSVAAMALLYRTVLEPS